MKSCKLEPLARIPSGGKLCIHDRNGAVGTRTSDQSNNTVSFSKSKSWNQGKCSGGADTAKRWQSLSIT